jgi:ribosomal protein S18 acetylase RimI-like enzyme
LRAAEDRLAEISPDLCAAYLIKWRADVQAWRQRFQDLPVQTSMSTALRSLSLIPLFSNQPIHRSALSRYTALSSVPNVEVREVTKHDWRLLRQVRLRALQDAPHAFISSYKVEVNYTERHWRDLIRDDSRWLVAFLGPEPVGLAAATTERGAGSSKECHVEGMWVAPSHRNSGVARELMTKLINTMGAQGVQTILLWVLDGNDAARNAYRHLGFNPTGERQRLRTDPSRSEEHMCLSIPRSAGSWLTK